LKIIIFGYKLIWIFFFFFILKRKKKKKKKRFSYIYGISGFLHIKDFEFTPNAGHTHGSNFERFFVQKSETLFSR
ncbi:unnamed protein product, partial [Staurois parvus]